LDEYFKRFDRAVLEAREVGCELIEQYLIKIFAQGCLTHKYLKDRAVIVHLEDNSEIQNYTDLKLAYENHWIANKEFKRFQNESARSLYTKHHQKKKKKPKCYNCGERQA
jgi:hypothetical protein